MSLISKAFAPYKVFSRDRESKKGNSERKRNLPYRKITDAESLGHRNLACGFSCAAPWTRSQLSGRLAKYAAVRRVPVCCSGADLGDVVAQQISLSLN